MKSYKVKSVIMGIAACFVLLASCSDTQLVVKPWWYKISYAKPTRLIYIDKDYIIAEDRNTVIVDGTLGVDIYNVNYDIYCRYLTEWDRKIRLRLPKGYRQFYAFLNTVVYPNHETVIIGSDSLEQDSTFLNIGHEYTDGIHHPSAEYINSLIYRAKYNIFGKSMDRIYMRQDRYSDGTTILTKPELIFFYLRPAIEGRRSILYVKDGVFVLAYNITERNYPLFEAYIRNTFVVCNRYMDIVDEETLEFEMVSGSPNVVRSQYMEKRFYKEIPTVTPPDSATIVEDAWRGTGFTPDMFPLHRKRSFRCMPDSL